MKVTLFSFGFKHGLPEADTVFDVRLLPNPYWDEALRDYSGQEKPVAAYVLDNKLGHRFQEKLYSFLEFYLGSYRQAEREECIVAVGCTGGRHRSVALVENLQKHLAEMEFELNVYHRDIKKV